MKIVDSFAQWHELARFLFYIATPFPEQITTRGNSKIIIIVDNARHVELVSAHFNRNVAT